jgi:RNA polymerase sigma factor (sigma-70 family)
MQSLPAELYQPDANNRPQEWWILWKIIHSQVEPTYRSYKAVHAIYTLDDLVDYTTDELVKSRTTLALEGARILLRAKRIAKNRCNYGKETVSKNKPKEANAFQHYYDILQDDVVPESEIKQKLQSMSSDELFDLIKKICTEIQYVILVMHFGQGKKFVEIAKQLGIDDSRVRAEARRGLERTLKSITK